MANNVGSGIIAVLAGAAIGAAAGILLAPEKGSKMRRRIKDGVSRQSDDLCGKIDDIKKQLKGVAKDKKGDLEDIFNQFVDNAGDKTEDVISKLEKKLEELKHKANKEVAKIQK